MKFIVFKSGDMFYVTPEYNFELGNCMDTSKLTLYPANKHWTAEGVIAWHSRLIHKDDELEYRPITWAFNSFATMEAM